MFYSKMGWWKYTYSTFSIVFSNTLITLHIYPTKRYIFTRWKYMYIPSSSLPIIVYLSKPLKFLCVPNPKSSFVHCKMPLFPITRHGNVTRVPTTVVWSCGSIANFCSWSTSATTNGKTLNIRSRSRRNLCCVVMSIVVIYNWNKRRYFIG